MDEPQESQRQRRSLRVRPECINTIASAVRRQGMSHQLIAERLEIARATFSNFCNGKPVDRDIFEDICEYLDVDFEAVVLREQLELEFPEGWVPLESGFYIEPPNLPDCYHRVVNQAGALIRIQAPAQFGKTSCTKRILKYAERQGWHTLYLSLRGVNSETCATTRAFLRWLNCQIANEIGCTESVDEFWQETDFSANDNCTRFIEEQVLDPLEVPLVLAIDDLDYLYPYPPIGDLLALLRGWSEEAKEEGSVFRKLKLVLAYAKDATDLPPQAYDIHHSPFNVGFYVQLEPLNRQQIKTLAKLHQLQLSNSQIAELESLLGGHPYLIRTAFYELAQKHLDFATFVQQAQAESGIFKEHWSRLLINLEKNALLTDSFKQILSAQRPIQIDSTDSLRLQNRALIKFENNGYVVQCDLYRTYFNQKFGLSR
jgi:transcriptional regulator with XRE-family HTH domain